jgi:hypothetical protein
MKVTKLVSGGVMLAAVVMSFAFKPSGKLLDDQWGKFVYNGQCLGSAPVNQNSCSATYTGPQCTISFALPTPIVFTAYKENTPTPCSVVLRQPF